MEWIESGEASILIQGFRLKLDSTCVPVAISTINDPDCESGGSLGKTSDNTAAIVGRSLAAIVLTLSITVVLAIVLRSRRYAMLPTQEQER